MATITHQLTCHPEERGISFKYPMRSFTLIARVYNLFIVARVQDDRKVVDEYSLLLIASWKAL
jgi:hypothetical protein